jgi:hypothetical protein
MSMTGRYLCVPLSVIAGVKREPSTLLEVLYPEPEPAGYPARYLDIDKTWHIIHFLLNGHAWEGDGPLFDAVLGGSHLTDEDLGYGPPRFLEPAEVVATAQALDHLSAEELWSRFDESRVREAELYWSTDAGSKEYALGKYEALRSFFRATVERGAAAILWLA